MNTAIVARRYAQALYEIAIEHNVMGQVKEDMRAISIVLEGAPEIRRYCFRINLNRGDEKEFINIAFIPYVGSFTRQLLEILVRNRRLSSLPFLPVAFDGILDEKAGVVTVDIESAHQLTESIISGIREKMKRRIGKEINIRRRILPELLGGFRILWRNKIVDFTVRGRLKELRRLVSKQQV